MKIITTLINISMEEYVSYYDTIINGIYASYRYIATTAQFIITRTGFLYTNPGIIVESAKNVPVVIETVAESNPSPIVGIIILAGVMIFNLAFGGNASEKNEDNEESKKTKD